jgi:glycosyltransferase involved in cell wall biosynthesis
VQVGAREWKGWRDLLAGVALIAKEFPTLKTAVVACEDTRHQAVVASIAREHGIADRVLPIGFRDDMPDVLMAADIVADMSYAGTGVTGTLREAMALGTPVIGSAVGGNPELVVDGKSGLIVPPRQPAALAGALRRLLSDRALADRLGQAGRARVVAGFSSEARLDRIEALYRALASARHA